MAIGDGRTAAPLHGAVGRDRISGPARAVVGRRACRVLGAGQAHSSTGSRVSASPCPPTHRWSCPPAASRGAGVDRLHEVEVGPGPAGQLEDPAAVPAGLRDDQHPRHQPSPHRAAQVVTAHAGQADVEQQHVRRIGFARRQPRLAVVGHRHGVAFGASRAASESAPSRLSSTISTRRPVASGSAAASGSGAASTEAAGGQRQATVNVLPWPGRPVLSTATSPPCRRTMPRTSDKPRPSPPSDRSRPALPARICRRHRAGRRPGYRCPGRARCIDGAVGRHHRPYGDGAAGVHVLAGVVQEIGEDLREAGGVALEPDGGVGQRDRHRVVQAIDVRLGHFDGPGEDVPEEHPFLADAEAARGDAADVEQVVDEAHHVIDLARDDAARGVPWAALTPGISRTCTAFRIGARGLRSSWASVARTSSLRRLAALSCRWRLPAPRCAPPPGVRGRPGAAALVLQLAHARLGVPEHHRSGEREAEDGQRDDHPGLERA